MAEAPTRDSARAMMAEDRASAALGIEVVEYGAARAIARMRVTEDMVNGHGIAHGGMVFALADTTFACACNADRPTTVAAGADIVFVAPAHTGDMLTAEAVERVRYGRSGVYDVTVTRGTEVVAEFRGRARQIGRDETGSGPAPVPATDVVPTARGAAPTPGGKPPGAHP